MYLLSAAAVLALLSGASSQNVVHFNLTRGRPALPSLPGLNYGSVPVLNRRAGTTYPEELINSVAGAGYYVQVQVGTPPQTQTLLLDTGSSDAWVLSQDADICTSRDLQQQHGVAACADTYDAGKSETSAMVEKGGFRIVYLDGGTASGDYVADDLSIGGATIKALQLARVTRAVRGTGILGLGYAASERATTKYPNLIDAMANQGLIDCKAYSLYLNDRRADGGSVLFGGLDTDKFIGPLSILPLSRPPGGGNYSSFEVDFAGISVDFPNGTSLSLPTSLLSHPAPAVLDSGTTLSYLPDKLSQSLSAALNAVYDPDLRMTLIDCLALPTSSPNLSLTFSFPLPTSSPSQSQSQTGDNTTTTTTTSIRIPVSDLILPLLPPSYPAPPSFPSRRACVLGVQSTATFAAKPVNYTLLGATFLRAAYVVHDLSHHQLGIAQANLNSSASRVVAMSAAGGGNAAGGGAATGTGIPRVTGVSAQQTTFTPTATGAVGFGGAGGGGTGAGGGVGSGADSVGVGGIGGVVMGVVAGLVVGFGL